MLPPIPPTLKIHTLRKTLLEPYPMTSLRTMRARHRGLWRTLLLLPHLVLLKLILREAADDGSADGTEEAVASLVASVAACQTAGDGAAEAAVGVCWLGLVVGEGSVVRVSRWEDYLEGRG